MRPTKSGLGTALALSTCNFSRARARPHLAAVSDSPPPARCHRLSLRIARAPTMLDSSVMRRFVDILPWAVWVHFALTAWMYATLPSYIVGGVNYNPGAFTDMTGQFDIPVRLRKARGRYLRLQLATTSSCC